ncbi:MAG: FMN-binding protein [Clostridiales bacterium]|nr:FMN-binding protein [Clostridiales bacterium]
MKKSKRWIGVAALTAVTVVAFAASLVIKNNLNKGPANAIAVTQEGTDAGIKQIEAIKDGETVTGYKVNVDAKGFGDPAMDLMITFNAAGDTVTSLEVISQNETEGFGANITKPEFLDQFNNVQVPVFIAAEPGEGTEIDAISGATITSKAVVAAINGSQDYLTNNVVE